MSFGFWDHGGWDRGVFLFFTLRGLLICFCTLLFTACLALIYGIKR